MLVVLNIDSYNLIAVPVAVSCIQIFKISVVFIQRNV
jgi:hypothetical protein